jgi:hypothetical protein
MELLIQVKPRQISGDDSGHSEGDSDAPDFTLT